MYLIVKVGMRTAYTDWMGTVHFIINVYFNDKIFQGNNIKYLLKINFV